MSVLLLGDPRLRAVAPEVRDFDEPAFQKDVVSLHAEVAGVTPEQGGARDALMDTAEKSARVR